MNKNWLICLLLILFHGSIWADDFVSPDSLPRRGFFCYAPYGRSLYADVHPNFIRLDFAYHTNHPSYDWSASGRNYRWSVEGVFGENIPLWRCELAHRKYGLYVSIPLSADLWLDLFERTTAPVINTDYRIGAPIVTFIHRTNKGFLQNYSVAWSLFKHESTHIGDELTLDHVDKGYALRRVNVSYNYTELAFTINEPEERLSACHTFRLGAMLLYNPQAGWYTVYEPDGDASLLSKRISPWEVYLQYQYQSTAGKHGFQAVASAEVRNRALYGYTYNGDGLQDERRVFTYSAFVGARYNTPHYDGYFSRFAWGLRAYHGNCPHGQFRNLNNYSQIGLSLIFE